MTLLHPSARLVRFTVLWIIALVANRAVAEQQVVTVKPDFKQGERVRYTFYRSKHQGERPEHPATTIETRMSLEIVVLEVRPEGYLLRWTYGKPEFEGRMHGVSEAFQRRFNEDAKKFVGPIGDLIADLPVEIEMDARPRPVRVKNWDVVIATIEKSVEMLKNSLPPEKEGAESSRTFDSLWEKLRSREFLEANCLKEARKMFPPFTRSYRVGETLEFRSLAENVFGGPPLESNVGADA